MHGVPDTHDLWDDVLAHLSSGAASGAIAPDLPGFGCPVPDGFTATKEEYLAWLIGRVEEAVDSTGGPVDLVGHDWGTLLTQRLAVERPDLVRTLASGAAALEPTYEWHEFAKAWQRPETGIEMVPTSDARMAECILSLYRSAVDVYAEWTGDIESLTARSLVVWGADDPFVGRAFGERFAERTKADLLMLEGCGHWWPRERPAEVAAALEAHWNAAS